MLSMEQSEKNTLFYQRFLSLCNQEGIAPGSAKILDVACVSFVTLANWKRGILPTADVVIRLAKRFNVTTDYLLGLSDDKGEYDSPNPSDTSGKRQIRTTCLEGVCPVCGSSTLSYGTRDICSDNGGTQDWECCTCGATGEEGFDIVFDGNHYNVHDADGKEVEILPEITMSFSDIRSALPKEYTSNRAYWSPEGGMILCRNQLKAKTLVAFLWSLGIPSGYSEYDHERGYWQVLHGRAE